MDTPAQKINSKNKPISYGADWRYETLPRQTKKALMFLSKEKWLRESEWYLAGGTALSLRVGNRKSFDLDFFTQEKDFDEKKLIARFIDNNDWRTEIEDKNTVYGELFKAKVSFIAYPAFLFSFHRFCIYNRPVSDAEDFDFRAFNAINYAIIANS